MKIEELLEQSASADEIIIYGAHLIALECCRWLLQQGAGHKILGFAVTDTDNNQDNILGCPVKKIEQYKNLDATIMIAMPSRYHEEVERYVKQKKFSKILKIGLEDMSVLKGKRLSVKQKEHPLLPFILEEDENDPGWMNMIEKALPGVGCGKGLKIFCKYPTLFYLELEEMLRITSDSAFCEEYRKLCGCCKNLHALPTKTLHKSSFAKLKKTMTIYMAFSAWDSGKTEQNRYEPWISPLQVGCRLSEKRFEGVSDDQGDNISEKNRLFAEMTGAYWIWKHELDARYKGLCHYRRHFMISQEEITALEDHGVDVILTVPRYVPGGIKNMFLEETPVKKPVFEKMIFAVSELYPDEKTAFEEYMDSCIYYPNNMVVAKNDIYNDYCNWIFPVLFKMEQLDIQENYSCMKDRHIAYAAELLTSYYFVKNSEFYQIVMTEYIFYF